MSYGLVWVFQKLRIYWDLPQTISTVYREWSEREKIPSEQQFCGWEGLVDAQGLEDNGQIGSSW